MALPGFADRLAELPRCEVVSLPRGAAALGALAFERVLRRDPTQLTLVQRLRCRWRNQSEADTVRSARVAAADRPTHVVYRGRAWALGHAPLHVGRGDGRGLRSLTVPAGPACRGRIADWRWTTRARGSWTRALMARILNGERVSGRVSLRAGDRLRLGNPGIELDLIRLVDGDGAP